jgi:hypothetical protein
VDGVPASAVPVDEEAEGVGLAVFVPEVLGVGLLVLVLVLLGVALAVGPSEPRGGGSFVPDEHATAPTITASTATEPTILLMVSVGECPELR